MFHYYVHTSYYCYVGCILFSKDNLNVFIYQAGQHFQATVKSNGEIKPSQGMNYSYLHGVPANTAHTDGPTSYTSVTKITIFYKFIILVLLLSLTSHLRYVFSQIGQ